MIRKLKKLLKGNKGNKQVLPAAFLEEFRRLKELESSTCKRFTLEETDFYPCLNDNTSYTGFDRHYVYHPAWAARILRRINPEKHIDISSTLYFCSLLSRSEEHTSELQSLMRSSYAVFCLKKKIIYTSTLSRHISKYNSARPEPNRSP